MLFSAIGLLGYLWFLVHFGGRANDNKDSSWVEADDDLGELYTVYACALLLLAGISVLWR